MINQQNYYILKLIQECNPYLQKVVLQICSKELLRFLCEFGQRKLRKHLKEGREEIWRSFEEDHFKKTAQKERKEGLQLSNLLTRITIKKFQLE